MSTVVVQSSFSLPDSSSLGEEAGSGVSKTPRPPLQARPRRSTFIERSLCALSSSLRWPSGILPIVLRLRVSAVGVDLDESSSSLTLAARPGESRRRKEERDFCAAGDGDRDSFLREVALFLLFLLLLSADDGVCVGKGVGDVGEIDVDVVSGQEARDCAT